MAAIKRILLPPMLKTVKLPTWSALPKVFRNSANDLKSFVFVCLYQCCKADLASGCFLANSFSRLRVMMCMVGFAIILPAVTDENSLFDAPRHVLSPVIGCDGWFIRENIERFRSQPVATFAPKRNFLGFKLIEIH